MPFNRQYMGTTGAFTASSILFPPQASIRTAATGTTDAPESPVILMRAAPNTNEIWRISAGDIVKVFLIDTGAAQCSVGQVYIGKILLGGQGTRWYDVTNCNQIASPANSIDVNNANRMQQSMRIHPGEEIVLGINPGGTAWDPTQSANSVNIPYEVAAGVTPAQMAASLRAWG